MKLYAIIDYEAKCVVSTFTAVNDAAAQRSFLMLLTSPNSTIFTDFPEQFGLYPVCELKFDSSLTVSAHGLDNVNAAGFKIDTFKVTEPIQDGRDYDKRYLTMVRSDRGFVSRETNSSEEDENNG